jgi:hypothetical protein
MFRFNPSSPTTTPLDDTLKDIHTSWPDTTANEVTPSTEPGTSSRQQAEASLASQGNPKRRSGSDDEYTEPNNHTLDTILEKPAKRKKESTGDYKKPNATATHHVDTQAGKPGDAASLTTNEAQNNVQAAAGFRAIMQHNHGLQSQAGSVNEEQRKKSPTTPQGQAIYDDPVSRVSTTATTQPETPSRLRQPRTLSLRLSHSHQRRNLSDTFDDYDSILVIDSSNPNVPVHSGNKKRLGQRVRKMLNKNTPHSTEKP